jgi:UDP-N-acetylglucosamine diphosphorylase / glucose-1-phosphate thymidylyltransferase / UDP-N-acetylgalactosamine diphosphorylase / glucosamine-1-phosphate N-acetyltransferase / galactosamine-1-phosphate N-acetyltransferase
MNSITLDDSIIREDLFPFTLTRHTIDIRIGILTLREKWKYFADEKNIFIGKTNSSLIIPANIIPTKSVIDQIKKSADINEALLSAKKIQYPWHIFQLNNEEIKADFDLITNGRISQKISSTNKIISPENIFVEEGAIIEHSILNASFGPIYIGKKAEIMEGSIIRGPFALCEGAIVKMGAKIYGATTIGPFSVVGGEIKNSVIFGYSNKAHDGYLGDSVIGEWCNFGAGTSNSNIKNTATDIQVWNEGQQKFINAGTKCGLLMGDYSRSAINTSFNTGTVAGVCCNIFNEGLTSKFIPNFCWGVSDKPKYRFEKALQDISNWKKLKNHILSDDEIQTLKHIFEQS